MESVPCMVQSTNGGENPALKCLTMSRVLNQVAWYERKLSAVCVCGAHMPMYILEEMIALFR